MRILCISAQKPDSTGSGVYLAETVRSMLAAGHEVAVIAGIDVADSPDLPRGAEFFPVRFNTPDLPFPVCGMSDVMPYEATRYRDMTPGMVKSFREAFGARIREAALVFKPDAIICHHLYLVCSIACEVLDELAGENWSPGWSRVDSVSLQRPCAIWAVSHSTDLRQLQKHDLEKERIVSAVRTLDGIMALHEAQKEEIVELFGVEPGRVRVVGTGYSAREFNADGARRPASPLRILYVGKICRAKGVESLVRCANALPFDAGEVEISLVGGYSDQDQHDQIAALAKQSRIPVHFCGRVSQDELVEAYRTSHVFVLPSFFEGLPLVTIEAMACGCRAVVTDLPGVKPWLAASLPGAPVAFVAPPRLIGTDQPVEEDLPAFETALAQTLAGALSQCAKNPTSGTGFDTTGVSWDSLAARMAALLRP